MFSTCKNDDSFGPGVSGCRDDFDFTIKFELLIFSIVPATFFITLAVWRIGLSIRKPAIVHAPKLLLLKLVTIGILAALEFVLLILAAIRTLDITPLTIVSTALAFVAALCMVPLSFSDHGRAARPSVLLAIYLFPTLLLDVAQTRTYWLAARTRPELTYAAVFTASMSIKAVILILEAQPKTKWLTIKEPYSPEETSSIYSLGVFFWLNNVFLTGYRQVMDLIDLYPLDREMAGAALFERFQQYAVYPEMRGDKYGLAKALAKTLQVPILLVVIPRLLLIAFRFSQPFLISTILDLLSEHLTTQSSVNAEYGLIGACGLIYAGIAISTAFYWYFHYRTLIMARGVLVTAIYVKATEAQVGPGDSSASITLMSIDIERIVIGLSTLHEAWAGNIEVAIASYLLYRKLGAAFAAPLVVVALSFLAISVVVNFTGNAQRRWMTRVQRRVGLTSNVIGGMKNIKVAGLTGPIGDFIQSLRVDELNAGSRLRQLNLSTTALAFGPLFISPVVTFAFAQHTLDTTTLFTSYSYLVLLATPLTEVIKTVQLAASALACIGRIQAFLETPPRDDLRMIQSSSNLSSDNGSIAKTMMDVHVTPISDRTQPVHPGPSITVSDGEFGWVENKPVLKDINIQIPHSTLTMVVGPIASGKSTLIKSLLSEIPSSRGSVTMSTHVGRIAYCDQTPFLSNSTIRENILGFSAFDPSRYADTVKATMLEVDFETLAQRDETIIGSNGITLSGGQKQRISLARALYLQSDLLLFDDVFSGLDADTEEQVFSRVFGPGGIIQRRQATAVLCTHSVRHLPFANHIIVLGNDGSVVEQGSFEQLVSNGNYVHSLGLSKLTGTTSDSVSSVAEDNPKEVKLLEVVTAAAQNFVVPKSLASARQLGDWTVYKHYFKSMGFFLAVLLLLCAVLHGFFYNFPTIWLKYWSADVVNEHPLQSSSYYIGIYALLQALALIFLVALGWLIWVTAIRKSGTSLHSDALRTLMRAPLRFFTKTDQGVVTNLFSQDLNLVDTELPNALFNALFNIAVAIGQAAVIVTASPYIAISYPFLLALMWVIQKFYLRTSRQLRILDLETKSPLYTHFIDTIRGIVTLRAFNFVSEDRAKSVELLDASQRPFYLLLIAQQWLVLVLNIVVMVLAVVLVTLALQLRSNSGFTGASLVSLMSFGDSLSSIVMQWTKLETSIGAIGRLRTFSETVEPENKAEEKFVPAEDWPSKGQIELRGVSASYDAGTTGEEPSLALNNVHLSIKPGEKVAICGRTGSGKSSMLALLLKLLEPTRETGLNASIDDVPLNCIDRHSLRLRLIAMPQDAVFLPDGSTFQQNLDPFTVADAPQCRAALETVGLWPLIEDRGGLHGSMKSDTLSQGQRQLFSLAHVILRRRIRARKLGSDGQGGILLLDEVTSSVDRETENTIQSIIEVEFRDYTILAISHRLQFIIDFDRVVVMDKGKVVEVGNPRELAEGETRFDNRRGTLNRLPSQSYITLDEFGLESGEVLTCPTVAFTTVGQLNASRTNVILICHALSGSADCFDWWSLLLSSPAKPAIDTTRFFVICCNALGSPYGSSSPLSCKPNSVSSYGNDFPKTTIRDDVRIQRNVLDILGVQSIYCVIGGSMGGMQALEWSFFGKHYVRSLVLVATTARQSPWAIAWAENQRATIQADAKYQGGRYGDDPPVAGLRAARMAAMLSYRTHLSFEKRFGRQRVENDGNSSLRQVVRDSMLGKHHRDRHGTFLAQSYLRYQGDKFNERFDASCYLHLLDKMDSHDITRGRCAGLSDPDAMKEVLGEIQQRALVVGIPTDGLYPLCEQLVLFECMSNATFATLDSEDGHDGFLLEGAQLNDLLHTFFGTCPLPEEELIWDQVMDFETPNILTEREGICT